MAKILAEVTKDVLTAFQEKAHHNQLIIIKFGAEWCAPCESSKSRCYEWFSKMPANIMCADIDIDDHIDLYVALKSKKMLKGVPILMAYTGGGKKEHWYIPDESISGADLNEIDAFFEACIKRAK